MKIPFIKMQGLGNDFIIFDNIKDLIVHDTKFIKKISNRRLGIGCDQVLIIEDTLKPQNFKVTIYNSNGSETGACGNGTRCVADYLMKRDNLNSLNIQSISGNLTCTKSDNVVTCIFLIAVLVCTFCSLLTFGSNIIFMAAMFFIIGDKRILRFDIAHEQVGCQEQGAERR